MAESAYTGYGQCGGRFSDAAWRKEMTILFAPSESKRPGGGLPPISESAFFLPQLYTQRVEALKRYDSFVDAANTEALKKLFGIKDEKLFTRYRADRFDAPTMKAIRRYNGVAYDYLDYDTLPTDAQKYIDDNLVVFSNLFGPVRAKDRLPDYKLKQGETIDGFAPEKFYKEHFGDALTAYLTDRGPVVDLRAGFYEKFYKVPLPHTTMKFLKNGKSVSHWAKTYRGLVAREMARQNIQDEEALLAMNVDGLAVREILVKKRNRQIVYEIID
ncbi:YaaA family protein [Hydrogenimonas sp.]